MVPLRRVSLLAVSSLLALAGCTIHTYDDGSDYCPVDSYEGNDTPDTAIDLGELQDDPNSGFTIHGTIDSRYDEDWFRVHIDDTGFGGDPNITVQVPSGFTASTWFVCDGNRSSTTLCMDGYPASDDPFGTGGCESDFVRLTTDCDGTSDDNGWLYVRVTSSAPVCGYDLSIDVE